MVESDVFSNSLTVIARDADLEAIADLVRKLDESARNIEREVRTISLGQIPAVEIAELVRRFYTRMTDREVEVRNELPSKTEPEPKSEKPEPESDPEPDPDPELKSEKPEPKFDPKSDPGPGPGPRGAPGSPGQEGEPAEDPPTGGG